MKKVLSITVFALAVIATGSMVYAQAAQAPAPAQATPTTATVTTTTTTTTTGFDKRLKIEGYGEYINFRGDAINKSTWGGGILARYLFLDWFGAQATFSFYSKCKTANLGGDLSFTNLRVSLLLHTYVPDIDDRFYIYGGGGIGGQFNSNIDPITINNALTGHLMAGLGFDITEILSLEGEVGYQFGKADVSNYSDGSIGVEAIYARIGAGIRF